MMFRRKGKNIYELKLSHPDGRVATVSLGTTDATVAADVERLYQSLVARRRWGVIALLVEKRVSLPALYDADLAGTLEEKIASVQIAAADTDLRPLVEEWVAFKRKDKRGGRSIDDYRRQLETLFPIGQPFAKSGFTRVTIAQQLDALPHEGPTKNRYRAAASSFAKFLVRRGVLETNVVRDIEGFGENEPRVVYYERADAQRILAGLPLLEAGAIAFAAAFCAEWGAITRFTPADRLLDVHQVAVRVRGSKTRWRDRVVPLVPENRWILPYLERAMTRALPTATIFAGLQEWRLLRDQKALATALQVVAQGEAECGQHTIHDWRHTHTVQLLRDGYSEQVAASHLGDKNTDMVRKVYGRWIPTAVDYAKTGKASTAVNKRAKATS